VVHLSAASGMKTRLCLAWRQWRMREQSDNLMMIAMKKKKASRGSGGRRSIAGHVGTRVDCCV
jgi:hypothetical protein